MTETLQLEETPATEGEAGPRLLIEWTPRWENFRSSIGPALTRSAPRLAGESPFGLVPYRPMLGSFLLQAFVLFVLIVLPREIDKMRPYAAPRIQPDQVIYYSPDELPRTEDVSGAQAGASGRAGGQEAHHRTQTIHVARGASVQPKIVDAPNLKLPSQPGAVANLLAFKSVPGPPPAEGLQSSRSAPSLAANVIAPPATNIARDRSRAGLTLNSVIAPAPEVAQQHTRTPPRLTSSVVAPAPAVPSERAPLYAPKLDPSIIGPAPSIASERNRNAPSLAANVVAPAATNVSRNQLRSAPALNGTIIAPAPSDVTHEVSPSRIKMNNVAVVPPPVSAPERESGRNAKLNLPSPSVVAPPPSPDLVHDRRLESGAIRSTAPAVVPPPPTQAANGSIVSSIIGKLFGTQDVVPPPPNVSASSAAGSSRSINGGQGTSLNANVIPPPPSVGNQSSSGSGGSSSGRGQSAHVVPPPPSLSGAGGNGSGSSRAPGGSGATLGASNVIAPPPSINSTGSANGRGSGQQNGGGSGNGGLLASNVVPPPPSVGSGNGASGSGRRGNGLGGPGDVGSVLAPPKGAAGNGDNSGVVLSADPGSQPGLGAGGKGSLALSPSGGDKPGAGGSGGGSGIGNGTGPGSGLKGENAGAGKSGSARGSDPDARGGISPTPGPGGAGSSPTGAPAVPGVDVRGGSTSSTIVTLPSFDSGNSTAPTAPARSSVKGDQGPSITIVATSRSGGAFDFYGKLPGDNYTVYVDTNLGMVVMQFAEADQNTRHAGALTGPQGLRTDLPANLPHARMVVKCTLDASGNLKNLQVLEAGPAAMTAKIMAALANWKFRPAAHGAQPLEVNAILGFNIDTNDRY